MEKEEEEGFETKGETGHLVRARRTSQGGARSRGWWTQGTLLGVRASRAGRRKHHSRLEGPSWRRTLLDEFSSHVTSCSGRGAGPLVVCSGRRLGRLQPLPRPSLL